MGRPHRLCDRTPIRSLARDHLRSAAAGEELSASTPRGGVRRALPPGPRRRPIGRTGASRRCCRGSPRARGRSPDVPRLERRIARTPRASIGPAADDAAHRRARRIALPARALAGDPVGASAARRHAARCPPSAGDGAPGVWVGDLGHVGLARGRARDARPRAARARHATVRLPAGPRVLGRP